MDSIRQNNQPQFGCVVDLRKLSNTVPKWQRRYQRKEDTKQYLESFKKGRLSCLRYFLAWAGKLFIPDFLIGHPSLWDNLKTLKRHPRFRPLRIAILMWVIFVFILASTGIYSIFHTPSSLASLGVCSWPFTEVENYTYDSDKIEIISGVAKLITLDQTDDDNTEVGFGGGIYTETQWDTTNNWLELTATGQTNGLGDFTSRIMDTGGDADWNTLSWMPQRPLYKELPNNKGQESGYPTGNADMTGNVLLMHMNEQTPDWQYKRVITLSPQTPEDKFQIKVELDPSNFGYSKAKANGEDIRFYDVNENKLSYWIENWNVSGKSIIWVKVANSGTDKIFMHYGNSKAVSESNGRDTFEFFDDFEDPTWSSSHWTPVYQGTAGTWKVENGYAQLQNGGGPSAISLVNDVNLNDYIVEAETMHVGSLGPAMGLAVRSDTNGNFYHQELDQSKLNIYKFASWSYSGVASSDSLSISPDTWYHVLFRISGNSLYAYSFAHDTGISGTDSSFSSGKPGVEVYSETARFDNFRVRKYTSIESNATIGNEEAGTIIQDTSGEGNDGVAYGGVTFGANGKFNTALSFDGIDDYIAIQDLHFDTAGEISEITVCAWIKTSESSTNNAFVDFDRSEYWSLGVDFANTIDDGKISWDTTSSSSTIDDMGSSVLVNDGRWHQVCGVFDSSVTNDKKIYIDGELDGEKDAYSTGVNLGTGTKRYGFIGDGSEASSFNGNRNNLLFKGFIDEATIYSQALSKDEILDHYKRGTLRLKYQVRSCDDSVCDTEQFIGHDGTTSTYYSELGNSTTSLPSLSLSNVSNNRYFQYKAYLETDNSDYSPELKSVTVGPNHYPGDNPTVVNNIGQEYSNLNSFSETLGENNQGIVKYQISNNGTDWYWWNGSNWVAALDYNQTNTAQEINTNCSQFSDDVGPGTFYFKTFLHSDGTQQVELNQVDLDCTISVSEEPVYRVFSDFVYNQENDNLKIKAWLEKDGEIVSDPDSISCFIYDQNKNLLKTISSSSSSDGIFELAWKSCGLTRGETYQGKCEVSWSGEVYVSDIYHIIIPSKSKEEKKEEITQPKKETVIKEKIVQSEKETIVKEEAVQPEEEKIIEEKKVQAGILPAKEITKEITGVPASIYYRIIWAMASGFAIVIMIIFTMWKYQTKMMLKIISIEKIDERVLRELSKKK